MRTDRPPALKVFAVVQLLVCLLLVLSKHWWCGLVSGSVVDICWLLGAASDEFPRAFPQHHNLVFLMVWGFKYLLPLMSISVALLLLMGKQLKENLLLVFLSTIFTLVLAEVGLRGLNYVPGQFNSSRWLQPVDSLFVFEGFVTDKEGITKVDTGLTNAIMRNPKAYRPTGQPSPNDWKYWYEIGAVMIDHHIVDQEDTPENLFRKRLQNLRTVPAAQRSVSDSVFLHFANHPFNDEGFYSRPFTVVQDSLPRILLLGDSFTWGHSTTNKTSGFANELLARGYNVFNTGISGADVSQYLAILKKYGPVLQPDVVVCSFFMGNDVQYFERIPKQEVPLAFHTNAGVIYSNHHGVEFTTAQAAYDNVMSNVIIPQTTMVNRLMSKTVVSTYFWFFLVNTGMVEHEFFEPQMYPEEPLTKRQMTQMAAVCDSLEATFVLSVIPKLENGAVTGAENMPGIFGAVPYYQPEMTPEMYRLEDGHFNDVGHLYYADYLENLLDSLSTRDMSE